MNKIPKTTTELENWMIQNCYNEHSYGINGKLIGEGFNLEKRGEKYLWYYIERGCSNSPKYFDSESEAAVFAYQKIKDDNWAKSHMIGFTTDKKKSEQLAFILEEMNIEYKESTIPWASPNIKKHRIFVFGCDVLKVKHLIEVYTESNTPS